MLMAIFGEGSRQSCFRQTCAHRRQDRQRLPWRTLDARLCEHPDKVVARRSGTIAYAAGLGERIAKGQPPSIKRDLSEVRGMQGSILKFPVYAPEGVLWALGGGRSLATAWAGDYAVGAVQD